MTVRLVALAAFASLAAALPAGPTVSTLRADGALLVNGKPVFPCGFYISTGHTGDSRLRCVELVHSIGGNAVHIEGPWHEDTRFLGKAAELGVHVIAGHTETEDKLWRVEKYHKHPAIIAWTLYDDANTKSTVDHLRKMNKLVKAAAPNALTYIPLGIQNKSVLTPVDEFFDCSDIVGWENYPVAAPKADDSSLRATETQMVAAQAAARKYRRPLWFLPQTFAWPGGRPPTPTEYRNLCYVGLCNDAKAILPWCIYYKGDSAEKKATNKLKGEPSFEEWYLPDHPELWGECGKVAREVSAIAPHLLGGKYTKLGVGPDVVAAHWDGGAGDSLLVVANLHETEARAVKLTLPGAAASKLTPAFAARPAGLALDGAAVAGSLAPAEVQVYRVAR